MLINRVMDLAQFGSLIGVALVGCLYADRNLVKWTKHGRGLGSRALKVAKAGWSKPISLKAKANV